MSEASVEHCLVCNQPIYACGCEDRHNICAYCGCPLDDEAIEIGRETCFECYCERND
jgi:hypothetical protein